MRLDRIDVRLLKELQADSSRSLADLAAKVGLSPSACQRRIKALEAAGVIAGYAAQLDRKALGLSLEFFVEVSVTSQAEDVLDAFETAAKATEEIRECHLMAGATDYLLRVVARDAEDFERLHRERLSRLPGIASMRSNLIIRTARTWSGYPVERTG